jgi:dodecin
MTTLKVIEVLAESNKSWEDADQQAVSNASKTVRNVKSIWIENFEATVENGKLKSYRVNAVDEVKIGAAHASGSNAGEDLPAFGCRNFALDAPHRRAGVNERHDDRSRGNTRGLEELLRFGKVNKIALNSQSISTTDTIRNVRMMPSCSLSETYSPGANLCLSKRKPGSSSSSALGS